MWIFKTSPALSLLPAAQWKSGNMKNGFMQMCHNP